MPTIGTLWTVPLQEKGKIIRAVAAYTGDTVDIPQDYKHFEDNKKPEYTSKFVNGKIPALETKDGFRLFEGLPIARYVAGLAPNSGLLSTDPKVAALIDQWAHFAEIEFGVNAQSCMMLVRGMMTPYSRPLYNFFVERYVRSLNILEVHLATRTFLVGERITLADIVLAGFIARAGQITFDAEQRSKFPNVIRHLETVTNQPSVKDIFHPLNLVEKALQYTPPAKERKETKPAAAAPKAEKKPKAQDDDDDDEPSAPAEPKVQNPLDDLPKSNFNLEDWKRAYSNKETRGPGGALEWFYQNFDPQGFSIWRVDFKYNSELTQTYMSSNQITGFFNRLEASRKYLFGSVGVLGQNNDSVISGAFIMRGQDIKGVIDVAPDWESYQYTKLDTADSTQIEFFEAALAWDLEIDGKKWVDGKNFK